MMNDASHPQGQLDFSETVRYLRSLEERRVQVRLVHLSSKRQVGPRMTGKLVPLSRPVDETEFADFGFAQQGSRFRLQASRFQRAHLGNGRLIVSMGAQVLVVEPPRRQESPASLADQRRGELRAPGVPLDVLQRHVDALDDIAERRSSAITALEQAEAALIARARGAVAAGVPKAVVAEVLAVPPPWLYRNLKDQGRPTL